MVGPMGFRMSPPSGVSVHAASGVGKPQRHISVTMRGQRTYDIRLTRAAQNATLIRESKSHPPCSRTGCSEEDFGPCRTASPGQTPGVETLGLTGVTLECR